MIVLEGECGAEDPVGVCIHAHFGFAAGNVDDADAVIGTAEGDEAAVGVEADAEEGIGAECDGVKQSAFGEVPELEFAKECRGSAGDGEYLAVGGECEGFDALGASDQTLDGSTVVEGVNLNFVVAGNGQSPSVRGVVDCGDDGGSGVDRRIFGGNGFFE